MQVPVQFGREGLGSELKGIALLSLLLSGFYEVLKEAVTEWSYKPVCSSLQKEKKKTRKENLQALRFDPARYQRRKEENEVSQTEKENSES